MANPPRPGEQAPAASGSDLTSAHPAEPPSSSDASSTEGAPPSTDPSSRPEEDPSSLTPSTPVDEAPSIDPSDPIAEVSARTASLPSRVQTGEIPALPTAVAEPAPPADETTESVRSPLAARTATGDGDDGSSDRPHQAPDTNTGDATDAADDAPDAPFPSDFGTEDDIPTVVTGFSPEVSLEDATTLVPTGAPRRASAPAHKPTGDRPEVDEHAKTRIFQPGEVAAMMAAEAGSSDPSPEDGEPSAEDFSPQSFDELELPDAVRSAVAAMGWQTPTPVQALTFPLVTAGRDVLVQSQTGSGKTGAFCLPWLAQRFEEGDAAETGVQLLVLTPTRELAKQVCDQLQQMARDTEVSTLPIYGGTAMQPQLQALRQGIHAVVGTPGRILDHIRRRSLKLDRVRMAVLDEADEMLSMGFLEDIHAILDACSTERQTCLFSATVPPDIERIARRYMRDPESVLLSGDQVAAAEIKHAYYQVSGAIKVRDLLDMIALEEPPNALVFCNTREETYLVASALRREGYNAEPLSSDLTQTARERVMGRMRSGQLRFLVATDVASRGIDISHIGHVINYSFPENAESYVHRTGRTGRAGRPGVAISLIAPQELGNHYYLKLQYPSIIFEERALPPAAELSKQRLENKLDQVSRLFPELVAPEWTLLTRHLVSDPRGEQVVAYLLKEAMTRMTQERERGDLGESVELRRSRDGDRRGRGRGRRDRDERDRDRERPGRGRGRGRWDDERGERERGERERGERERGERERGERERGERERGERERERFDRDEAEPEPRRGRDDEAGLAADGEERRGRRRRRGRPDEGAPREADRPEPTDADAEPSRARRGRGSGEEAEPGDADRRRRRRRRGRDQERDERRRRRARDPEPATVEAVGPEPEDEDEPDRFDGPDEEAASSLVSDLALAEDSGALDDDEPSREAGAWPASDPLVESEESLDGSTEGEPDSELEGEPDSELELGAETERGVDAERSAEDGGRRRRRRRRRGRRGHALAEDEPAAEAEAEAEAAQGETTAPAPATVIAAEQEGTAEVRDEDEAVLTAADEGETIEDPHGPQRVTDPGTITGLSARRRRRRRRRRGRGRSEDETTARDEIAPEAEAEIEAEVELGESSSELVAEATEDEGGEGRRRRRRRRGGRRRGRGGESTEAAELTTASSPGPVHVSQEQIVIDIDETELEVVRDQFGEIDELDELTLKGRRRGVMDALQDEVELEDLSDADRDAEADDGEADDGEADDGEADDGEADDGEADEAAQSDPDTDTAAAQGDATPAEDDPREAKKRKRRRRRRKKKAPPPPPELTAPPHKDFWEVWANRFTFEDFEDNAYLGGTAAVPDEPEPEPPSEPPAMPPIEEEDTFVRVRLNVGRKHGKKAAHIRELLAESFGLARKAVRDLTVGEASSRFRLGHKALLRLEELVVGFEFDGIALTVTRIEPPPPAPAPASDVEAPEAETAPASEASTSEVSTSEVSTSEASTSENEAPTPSEAVDATPQSGVEAAPEAEAPTPNDSITSSAPDHEPAQTESAAVADAPASDAPNSAAGVAVDETETSPDPSPPEASDDAPATSDAAPVEQTEPAPSVDS